MSVLSKMRFWTRIVAIVIQLSFLVLIFPTPKGILLPSIALTMLLSLLLQYRLVNKILLTSKNAAERLSRSKVMLRFARFILAGAVTILMLSLFENTPEQSQQSAFVGIIFFVIGLAFAHSVGFGYVRYEEYLKEINSINKETQS